MCLMGIVQNLFLAYENTKVLKYIIRENNFDIADISSFAYRLLLQGGFCTTYFKGMRELNTCLYPQNDRQRSFYVLIKNIFDVTHKRHLFSTM